MTSKNKKLAIIGGLTIAALGVGYLVYKRRVNKINSGLMLEYINELPKENTAAAQTNIQNQISSSVINEINSTSASALKGKALIFDNKSYILGKNDKEISDKAVSITTGLRDAMAGVNVLSNVDEFMKSFSRIGNKNAMVYINILYKARFKETMWEAINAEKWLYLGTFKKLDVLNVADLPNYHPSITAHLKKLL